MARRRRARRSKSTTMGVVLDINLDAVPAIQNAVNQALKDAAVVMAHTAKQLAPVDPNSRKVRGLRPQWGDKHHRDTIYHGKAKERATPTDMDVGIGVKQHGFDTYYVRSASGMGLWLERGTKARRGMTEKQSATYRARKEVIKKHGLDFDREERKSMSRGDKRSIMASIRSLAKTGDIVNFKSARSHAATPPRPHFGPALERVMEFLARRLRNII